MLYVMEPSKPARILLSAINSEFRFLVIVHLLAFLGPAQLMAQTDQSVTYASYFGGGDEDYGIVMDVDTENNYVVVGSSESNTLIPTGGGHQPFNNGGSDGLIALFSSNHSLIWATYFGGEDYDIIRDVQIDPDGNIVICGSTSSTSGIATEGAFQEQLVGGESGNNENEGFLAKFSPNGNLLWSTYFGGEENDEFRSLQLLDNGNIVVAGFAQSDSLATPGSHKEEFYAGSGENVGDGLIACFSTDGERIWSTYFGGEESDIITVIKVVPGTNGEFIVAGGTTSAEGISAGNQQFSDSLIGERDVFYARFDAEGNQNFGTYFGSEMGSETLFEMDLSPNGEVLLVGYSLPFDESSSLATPGAFQTESSGVNDGFVAKFSAENELEWATYLGGSESDIISVGKFLSDGIVVNLNTSSIIPTVGSPLQPTIQVPFSAMLAKFSYSGEMLWSTYIDGGSGLQMRINDIRGVNNPAEFYICGTADPGFEYITEAAYQFESNGNADILIARLTDETVVGLEDSPDFADISIYPNPGNGSFRIKAAQYLKPESLTVYDTAGRVVFSKGSTSTDEIINTNLQSGIYFVDLECGKESFSSKLIVR